MASADEALVAILKADAGVAALVGGRVYSSALPREVTYPAIRFQRISTQLAQYRVLSTGKACYEQPRFQVDGWALTSGEAVLLAQAIQTALDGYRGTAGGLAVDAIQIEDRDSGVEPKIGPESADVYRQRIDAMMFHPTA